MNASENDFIFKIVSKRVQDLATKPSIFDGAFDSAFQAHKVRVYCFFSTGFFLLQLYAHVIDSINNFQRMNLTGVIKALTILESFIGIRSAKFFTSSKLSIFKWLWGAPTPRRVIFFSESRLRAFPIFILLMHLSLWREYNYQLLSQYAIYSLLYLFLQKIILFLICSLILQLMSLIKKAL